MGMSASQARLLSLTARMHDLEFQAQGLQYSKLDLVNLKNDVYDEYLETLESTKMQMAVLTTDGKVYQDLTYTNMVMSLVNGIHPMYMLTNDKDQIYLPKQITDKIGVVSDSSGNHGDFLNSVVTSLEDFLKIVARNYLYSGRVDLQEDDLIRQMKSDGNYDYWVAIYHQIGGYKDDDGNIVSGRGFTTISAENAVDRGWLEEKINSGEARIYKLTSQISSFNGDGINIFAESSISTDTELREVQNDELIQAATIKYEKAIKDIDEKETKFDLQLARIDQQHNALKTEYDSVKQIVSKNIERSFKSFNA